MDFRIAPINALTGANVVLAHAESAGAQMAAATASAGILSGLHSSLAQAGLMAAEPAATESATSSRLDVALSGPGTHTSAATEARVAQPLTPAWVTALQAPAIRLGPWPEAPERHRAWHDPATAWPDAADADTPPNGDEAQIPEASADQAPPDEDTADPGSRAWLAGLPEEVQTELVRGRSVLLVAPPGPNQRGLQLALLGVGARGQPQCLRLMAHGAPAATANGIDWLCWRVRREGEDGRRAVLTARATSGLSSRLHGLVLRATATREPPPLRPPAHAWLDILEPQRLWRALGSQWTVLLAWSPCALPGSEG